MEIVFDDMAVPHIYAESEHDALHALGYVHAMERLWQMDLLRRAGGGRAVGSVLLLGPDMIDNDKYLRTLGMRKTADRTVEQRIEAGQPRKRPTLSTPCRPTSTA